MSDTVKIFFERDGETVSQYSFDNNKTGQQALGELIFIALQDGRAAYIMITPDDVNELMEEEDNGN